MNERIRELAAQAWVDNDQLDACGYTDLEKFAELIVRECAEIALVDGQSTGNFDTFNKIQKHFGVEE
jgi:hypothetical protein